MRTTILLCLALSLAACFQPEPDGDDGFGGGPSCPTFSCSTDADCLQGFVCSHGACSMPVSCGELPSQCPQDGYQYGWNDCLWSGCDCWFNDQTPPQPPPSPPPPPPQDSCGESPTCTTAPPACPAGQIPELQDGCYTGACRAIAGCDVPPACTALTHEDDCTARPDCEPLYTGIDCTDASGNACTMGDANCTCKEFDFSSCAAK